MLDKIFDLQEERELSAHSEDGFLFRAQYRARKIAEYLIDDGGKIRKGKPVIYEGAEFPFYWDGEKDVLIREHQSKVLQKVELKQIERLTFPLCHKGAEKLIRETLGLGDKEKLENKHLRRAVLASLLSVLRQNIGSCFATAPAILIHENRPEQVLQDFQELLFTGKLKRTFGGIEYSVPLSLGRGHTLLKAWEYTIASFSEVKMEFAKWNLYSSLGLNPEEEGGIGQVIYKYTQEKLEECNEKIGEYQREYEAAFHQLKTLESQAKNQGADAYIKAQYTAFYHQMRSCEDLRDKFYSKGSYLVNFYNFILEKLSGQFPEYFQELYDPELKGFHQEIFDDIPAGFRLVYKHGRADPSLWTSIHNQEEWVSALIDFFKRIEPACVHETLQEEVEEVFSLAILHLYSKEFVETALKRAAPKKPWAYISGGTMETLVRTYARREGSLTEESRVPESPVDLLTFLIDVVKSNAPQDMLMYSPTHACILKPSFSLFSQAWQDRGFTYTWIRDQYILPRKEYYAKGFAIRKQDWVAKAMELLENENFLPFLEKQRSFFDSIIPPDVFIDAIFACILQAKVFSSSVDLHQTLVKKARAQGYIPPEPLIFADTNWTRDYFAFVINPLHGELELWRVNYTGTKGTPMTSWNKWLNGSQKQPWGVYTKPYEYNF